VGKNKHLREIIAGNEAQVAIHKQKIADEQVKAQPNLERIDYWEKEIGKFEREIRKYSAKLPGGKT